MSLAVLSKRLLAHRARPKRGRDIIPAGGDGRDQRLHRDCLGIGQWAVSKYIMCCIITFTFFAISLFITIVIIVVLYLTLFQLLYVLSQQHHG